MTQGLIGGATSYEEQSLNNILGDVQVWIEYTQKMCTDMNSWLECLKESKFWEKVPVDFQMTVFSSLSYYDTIISDLSLIKSAIENDCITKKEVDLLQKIGRKAHEYNREYPLTYNEDKRYWHEYENPQFKIVEKMYAKGRDYFVTLLDARNAAARLEDYMSSGQIINNTVNISGNVQSSQIQQGTIHSTQTMNNGEQFSYEEVLEVLQKIIKISASDYFNDEFEAKADEFKELVDEAIKASTQKESPSKIKSLLSKIKDIAMVVGTNVIATGIATMIENVLFKG